MARDRRALSLAVLVLGRTAACLPVRAAAHVAAGPVAEELLAAGPVLLPRPEAVLPATRLANREIRRRALRRRLSFGAWKRRANQRTMDRPFGIIAVASAFIRLGRVVGVWR